MFFNFFENLEFYFNIYNLYNILIDIFYKNNGKNKTRIMSKSPR